MGKSNLGRNWKQSVGMVSEFVEPLKFSNERVLEKNLHGFKRSQLVGYRFGSGIDTGEPRYLKADKFEPIWRYSR